MEAFHDIELYCALTIFNIVGNKSTVDSLGIGTIRNIREHTN